MKKLLSGAAIVFAVCAFGVGPVSARTGHHHHDHRQHNYRHHRWHRRPWQMSNNSVDAGFGDHWGLNDYPDPYYTPEPQFCCPGPGLTYAMGYGLGLGQGFHRPWFDQPQSRCHHGHH